MGNVKIFFLILFAIPFAAIRPAFCSAVADEAVEIEVPKVAGIVRISIDAIYFVSNRVLNYSGIEVDANQVITGRYINYDNVFSDSPSEKISVGKIEIGYPADRTRGEQTFANSPTDEDPLSNFTIFKVRFFRSLQDWFSDAHDTYNKIDTSELIYVHGYNTTFSYAAASMAQLKADLHFPGPVFLFSWPAGSFFTDYPFAESQEGRSTRPLSYVLTMAARELMQGKAKVDTGHLEVIAHSIGARLLLDSLYYIRDTWYDEKFRLKTLVLAAPDVSRDAFATRDLPNINKYAEDTLILCADQDLPLAFSSIYHHDSRPRLGRCDAKDSLYKLSNSNRFLTIIPFHGISDLIMTHSYFKSEETSINVIERHLHILESEPK